ncbi:PQQ-binding-like beta-propeller repeat protein [Planctomycetota bacterium]
MRAKPKPNHKLALAAIFVFCVAVSVGADDSAKANDSWPVFRGNSLCTGVAAASLPEKLDELWNFKVPDGAFDATPVISDSVVYIGDLDGAMFAIDLKTGAKKWKTTIKDSGFPASPAIKDGRLYIGDYDGVFYCFDAANGKEIWKFSAEAEISSPNFHKDTVVFASQDSRLYSLNAASGKLNWKFAIEDQIQCSPTIVEGRAFLAGCDAKLHIIDLEKGEAIASVDIHNPTGVTPAVLGDRVFFGTEGGEFLCVNWRTAKREWTYADENANQSIRSSPAVTDAAVVFGSRSKQIYALNPKNGKLIWKVPSRRGIDSSPVIAGDRVYVGVGDGNVMAINLKDHKIVWQYQANGGFGGSPAVANSRLVIASDEGIVYCFGSDKRLTSSKTDSSAATITEKTATQTKR